MSILKLNYILQGIIVGISVYYIPIVTGNQVVLDSTEILYIVLASVGGFLLLDCLFRKAQLEGVDESTHSQGVVQQLDPVAVNLSVKEDCPDGNCPELEDKPPVTNEPSGAGLPISKPTSGGGRGQGTTIASLQEMLNELQKLQKNPSDFLRSMIGQQLISQTLLKSRPTRKRRPSTILTGLYGANRY